MSDNQERHASDELSSAGKQSVNAAVSGVETGKDLLQGTSDLYEKYKDNKNSKKSQNSASPNGEGGSGSNAPQNKKGQQKNAPGNTQNRANQDRNRQNKPKTPFGQKKGNSLLSGGNAGKGNASNADKTKNFTSKVIPSITGRKKSIARRIINLIRKMIHAVVIFFATLPALVILILILFPSLFLYSLVYEVIETAVEGVMEFTYNFMCIGDSSDLTEAEKKELYKKAAEDFISDAEDAGCWVLDKLSNAAYTFFQFCDDVTDDDTWLGGFCDDMSNFFYKKHVDIEIYQKQKGDHLDSASLMTVMVIDELRSGYNDTVYLDLNEMLGLEWQKAAELKNYYCTLEPGFDNPSGIGPSEMIFYLEPPYRPSGAAINSSLKGGNKIAGFSDIESEDHIPTHNLPIVISDPDHYVFLQGETDPEGYIDDQGVQHLRDCIMYNPYGNTRSSLNVSTGSNYEMETMAAYLICVYSACTPYDKQSISDLVTKIHEGMHDTDVRLVKYDAEFSNVYYGSIVPRLYQPYVYTGGNTDFETGTPITGYFEKNGEREVIGMTPLTDRNEIDTLGWVDINGDAVNDRTKEEFPICLQVYSTDNTGKPFYSDSFTVISYDKTRNKMSYIPDKDTDTATINEIEDALGYHVTGIDEKHEVSFSNRNSSHYRGYVDFDWEGNFKTQAQRQKQICSYFDADIQPYYIYRYEFPFARVSVGGYDEGGGLDDYKRIVKITGEDASSGSYVSEMIYTIKNGDNYTLARYNGGVINGAAAWAYVGRNTEFTIRREDHKNYVIDDAEDGRTSEGNYRDLIFNDISIENWGYDTVWKDHEDLLLGMGANPCVYNAKMRYMISVDVTAIPNYTDFIAEAFGYEPSAPLNRDLDAAGNLKATGGKDVTQGELVSSTLKTYMIMLGIKEEVISANNPQVGTERTYSYNEVLEILRACRNQDWSVPDLNRKYMVFIALSACGHVQYELGGYSEAGLHFQEWTTIRDGSDPSKYHVDLDGNNVMDGYVDPVYGKSESWQKNYGYEYNGLDCSGFVSWIIETAFDPHFSRFDSSSVINIQSTTGFKTTENVLNGNATATSNYGQVFTNDENLKVGDIAVRRSYNKDTGTLSGHVAMYIGRNNDGTQNWVEMTRFSMDKPEPTAGARVFTIESYSKKRKAVYIHLNMIPKEPVAWTLMSPAWMLIPTQSEVSYYVAKKDSNQAEEEEEYE